MTSLQSAFMTLTMMTASTAHAQAIFYTTTITDQVWVADQSGGGAPAPLYTNASGGAIGAVGIDLDATTGALYWGGGNNGAYHVGSANGSVVASEIPGSDDVAHCCEALDLSIDAANGLYYAAKDNDGLAVGPVDGSTPLVSLNVGFDVLSVHYEPTDGRLFVTEDGGGIHEVDPVTGVPTLVGPAVSPRGLVYDPTTAMVYFVDRGASGIFGVPADGSAAPTQIFAATSPYHIDRDASTGQLYWTEFDGASNSNNGRIMTGDPSTMASSILFEGPNLAGIRGIAVGPGVVPAAPTLSIDGTCVAPTTFSFDGLSPNATFLLVRSSTTGDAAVPSGPCIGTVSGLSANGVGLVGTFSANANGSFMATPQTLPPSTCGLMLQALELRTCTFTNVAYLAQ